MSRVVSNRRLLSGLCPQSAEADYRRAEGRATCGAEQLCVLDLTTNRLTPSQPRGQSIAFKEESGVCVCVCEREKERETYLHALKP